MPSIKEMLAVLYRMKDECLETMTAAEDSGDEQQVRALRDQVVRIESLIAERHGNGMLRHGPNELMTDRNCRGGAKRRGGLTTAP